MNRSSLFRICVIQEDGNQLFEETIPLVENDENDISDIDIPFVEEINDLDQARVISESKVINNFLIKPRIPAKETTKMDWRFQKVMF